MKAIDANVILRLLLNDEPRQTALAAQALAQPCWMSLTVLLEVAWVLASRYRLTRHDVARFLREMASFDALEIEAREAALWCVERYQAGGDIADLLHLAAARDMQAFVTFDRGIAKSAGPDTLVPIETLA